MPPKNIPKGKSKKVRASSEVTSPTLLDLVNTISSNRSKLSKMDTNLPARLMSISIHPSNQQHLYPNEHIHTHYHPQDHNHNHNHDHEHEHEHEHDHYHKHEYDHDYEHDQDHSHQHKSRSFSSSFSSSMQMHNGKVHSISKKVINDSTKPFIQVSEEHNGQTEKYIIPRTNRLHLGTQLKTFMKQKMNKKPKIKSKKNKSKKITKTK
jgi:hypothetical protein